MIFFEVEIQTPTTVPGDDGWRPVMDGEIARRFMSESSLALFINTLDRHNAALKYRVREVQRDSRIRKL